MWTTSLQRLAVGSTNKFFFTQILLRLPQTASTRRQVERAALASSRACGKCRGASVGLDAAPAGIAVVPAFLLGGLESPAALPRRSPAFRVPRCARDRTAISSRAERWPRGRWDGRGTASGPERSSSGTVHNVTPHDGELHERRTQDEDGMERWSGRRVISAWVGGFAVTGVILAVSAYSATGHLLPALLMLAFSLLVGVLGGTAMAAEYRRKDVDVNAGRLPWSLRILSWNRSSF